MKNVRVLPVPSPDFLESEPSVGKPSLVKEFDGAVRTGTPDEAGMVSMICRRSGGSAAELGSGHLPLLVTRIAPMSAGPGNALDGPDLAGTVFLQAGKRGHSVQSDLGDRGSAVRGTRWHHPAGGSTSGRRSCRSSPVVAFPSGSFPRTPLPIWF